MLTGVIYFVMQSLLTYGLSLVHASVGAVMLFVSIPVSYILDIIFMKKDPSALEIVGVVLIIGTNIAITLLKHYKYIE